jgi:hypothetical protein
VLLDERGPGGAVPHPVHQLTKASAFVVGELAARVPEIVEVEADQPGRLGGGVPLAGEVAAPKLCSLRASEDQRARARAGEDQRDGRPRPRRGSQEW